MGGKVGKDDLLKEVMKKIPCEDLKSVVRDLLIEFGARPREVSEPEQK